MSLKIRNISLLSGYCKSGSRSRLCFDSKFRYIFRNVPVLEACVVLFSNCENLHISFECKHNKEMNWTNTCAYLGTLHKQNCSRLFVSDLHRTYCAVHFQTIEHIIYSEINQ